MHDFGGILVKEGASHEVHIKFRMKGEPSLKRPVFRKNKSRAVRAD